MDTTNDKPLNLTLVVAPDEDDDNYRDEQTRLLRDLIEDQIDEVDAQLTTGSDLPENVRAGEVVTIGQIALAVLPAVLPVAVTALFELLRDWRKGKAERSYTIEVGDIKVALPGQGTWEEAEERIKRLLELQNQTQR